MKKSKALIFVFLFALGLLLFFQACTSEVYVSVVGGNTNGSVLLEGSDNLSQKFKVGTTVTIQANPIEGYLFNGWYEETTLYSLDNPLVLIVPNQDLTLIANFIQNHNLFTVTWKDDNGTVLDISTDVPYGTIPTFTGTFPPRPGYNFWKWSPDIETIKRDTTFQALYSISGETFTFNFIHNDGINATQRVSLNPEQLLGEPNPPVRPGYSFRGWSTTNNTRGLITWPTYIKYDQNVYTLWNPITYTITYELDGATNHPENPTSYQINSPLITLKAPTKDGQTFFGWHTLHYENTKVIQIVPGSMGDLILSCRFVEQAYLLTFSSHQTEIIAPISVQQPTTIYESFVPIQTYSGEVFTGWTYDEAGLQPVIWPMTLDSTLTIYAQWQPGIFLSKTYQTGFNVKPVNNEVSLLNQIDQTSFDWQVTGASYITILQNIWSIHSDSIIEEGDFVLSTTIPQIYVLTGYTIELGEDGYLGKYEIQFGDYTTGEQTINNTGVKEYQILSVHGLKQRGTTFSLSLWSEDNAPIYLKTLTLTYEVIQPTPVLSNPNNWIAVLDVISEYTHLDQLSSLLPNNILQEMALIVTNQDFLQIELHGNWTKTSIETYYALLQEILTESQDLLWLQDGWSIAWDGNESTSSYWLLFTYHDHFDLISPHFEEYLTLNELKDQLNLSPIGMPSIGTYRLPVVLIDFPDHHYTSEQRRDLQLAFNAVNGETGWESVKSFYTKSSRGLLNLAFDFSPIYTAEHEMAYYNDVTDEKDLPTHEALRYLDSQMDFSRYDYNQDQAIDAVYFIYNAPMEYDSTSWWAWVASDEENTQQDYFDGKNMYVYAWISSDFMQYDNGWDDDVTILTNTFIHETGHILGLFDYYSPYNYMGDFDMMDLALTDHGAYNKLLFGWGTPYLASLGETVITLQDLQKNGEMLLIPNPNSLMENGIFGEYLVLSYYTPTGLNSKTTNSLAEPSVPGLIITHFDARLSDQPTESFFIMATSNNNPLGGQLIRLLEADLNDTLATLMICNSDLLQHESVNFVDTYAWNTGEQINIAITVLDITMNQITIRINYQQ